jgi:hypothetical protein
LHNGVEGAFGARPPAYIPNSNPSQARFNESTPLSRSYDLFCEGSQKHHPRALGFDDLIHDLRRSGIVLAVFVAKSVTLTFEGLSVRGAKIDLIK